MQFSDELEFTHRDRKDVYEHVERYGTVEYESARTALNMEPTAFGHHVAILKRDGTIRQDEDHLSVAFESGTEQRFTEDDIEVVIRQAHESDLSGLVGAIRTAIDDETYIVAENIADIVDHENVLLRHNDLRSRVFFVATVNEDVVGWVHLNAPEIAKLGHTAELTVGVLQDYRGYGIGSRLLQRGLEWATEQDYEKVYNSVPSTNEAAIEFLENHGWETEAIREDHYLIDGEYIDEVMMAVSL